MKKQILFELREDYYRYGVSDAKYGVFDTSYVDRTEDARLSYMAGWSSVPVDKYERSNRPYVI